MTEEKRKYGFHSREEALAAADELREAMLSEYAARFDRLLESEDFRWFLGYIADRAKYLGPEYGEVPPGGEWAFGYCAALRGLVNRVVTLSRCGAGWLGAYAAARAVADKQERENRK